MIKAFAGLEASWKALALTGIALLLLGLALLHPTLADPPVRDAIFSFRPTYNEGTSATLELRPPWKTTATAFQPQSAESRILISLPSGGWVSIESEIIGTPKQQWAVTVARDAERRTKPGILAGETMRIEGAQFPGNFGSGDPVRLEIAPRGAPEPGAELQIVRVRLSATPREPRIANVAGIIALAATPVVLVGFITVARRRELWRSAIAGAAFGLLLLAVSYHDPRALEFLAPACGVMLLVTAGKRGLDAGWKIPAGEERTREFRRAEYYGIAAILFFTLAARWEILLQERPAPLLPDARGYVQIAREGSFYRTGQDHGPWVREPLFSAVLRAWFRIAPDTETSARFASLLIGVGLVFMIWFVGRRAFSPGAALLAAAWAGLNRYLGGISVDVLRDDLMTACFLGLMAISLYAGERKWVRAAFFGIFGCAFALLRINNIGLLIPFVAIEAFRRRWSPAEIALVFAIAIPPIIPHLLFNAQYSHGDYMFSSDVHVRYYMNRDMIGQPGYPASLADWAKEPYRGDTMSTSQMLRAHPIPETAVRIVRGYLKIFVIQFPHGNLFSGREWVMMFGLIGGWFTLRRWRQTWWVLAWFALFLFPIAFVATIGIDYRLATPAAPLILWIWGEGVWRAAQSVYLLIRKNDPAVTMLRA